MSMSCKVMIVILFFANMVRLLFHALVKLIVCLFGCLFFELLMDGNSLFRVGVSCGQNLFYSIFCDLRLELI